MSYAFEHPTRLAVEIRRVAVERLDNALDQLGGDALSEDRMRAIHTARKDLKKTRSLMRLVRGSLNRDVYREGNDRLRSAAHELAAVRETDAMAVALTKLVEHTADEMSKACASAASKWVARLGPSESPADLSAEAARAAALIRHVRDDARLWSLGYGSWEVVEPGLRRGYGEGRRALAAAETSPDDETVHEWRKRVKDMWYSLRLLQRAWPPVLEVMADEAHRLSELLGDHHDLGEIAVAIGTGDSGLPAKTQGELSGHARARQDQLHGAAILSGRRLYAERPRRYSQRLEALWRAWETQS